MPNEFRFDEIDLREEPFNDSYAQHVGKFTYQTIGCTNTATCSNTCCSAALPDSTCCG